jgi:glycosyltransferase involved in cell wall biosynthesis
MKKILFLITQSEIGGAQKAIFELASGLDKDKYNILVASGRGGVELFQKLNEKGIKSFYLKHMKRTPLPWQALLSVLEIFNLLKKERPDIIFLCSTTAGLLGSIAVGLIRNSQYSHKNSQHSYHVIYRIGGWSFQDPRPKLINKILLLAEKLTASFKDKIIVNSEIDKLAAIENKVCSLEKIVKIYNGIDVKKLEFLSKEEARESLFKYITSNIEPRTRISLVRGEPRTFIVGTIANFYKTKGLCYLIEAIHILNTKYKSQNTNFIIIGDGKQRKDLESLIKKYNLENKVILSGKIPEAYKFLKAFDVFVLPSLKEGFPWVILEAMASKTPILATRAGALPEIIDNGKEGILVETKNSQILAEKIYWLLNHPIEAKNMGLLAKEKLEKEFSLRTMIKKTQELLA